MSVGAADIESSMDADVMENNAYFNHPCSGPDQKHYTYAAHMREYVSTDPRKASFPEMEPRSNILTQIMPTKIEGKPFVMTEWNEYGSTHSMQRHIFPQRYMLVFKILMV